jgi:hypothetical protein
MTAAGTRLQALAYDGLDEQQWPRTCERSDIHVRGCCPGSARVGDLQEAGEIRPAEARRHRPDEHLPEERKQC